MPGRVLTARFLLRLLSFERPREPFVYPTRPLTFGGSGLSRDVLKSIRCNDRNLLLTPVRKKGLQRGNATRPDLEVQGNGGGKPAMFDRAFDGNFPEAPGERLGFGLIWQIILVCCWTKRIH
jgi:hypothetical protein